MLPGRGTDVPTTTVAVLRLLASSLLALHLGAAAGSSVAPAARDAAQGVVAGNPSPPPTPRKLLSRAELRSCIQREEEIGRRQDAMRQAHDAHEHAGAKPSAEAMELARILRATDPNDAAAVDSYHQRNDARNAEVDSHDERAVAINAAVAELQEAGRARAPPDGA